MFTYLFIEIFALVAGSIALVVFIIHVIEFKKIKLLFKRKRFWIPLLLFVIMVFVGLFGNRTYAPNFAMPMWMHAHTPDKTAASLPFLSIIDFFKNTERFEKVENIGADPNTVPPATKRSESEHLYFELTAKEVIAEVSDGISFNYWTYNNQVPGPMLRARVGDTITLTLTNDPSSLHAHNIDLHAVTGSGGGAALTHVMPGESKTFTWKALNPGLFIYHCAMPNVSTHNSHGQYGLILIEPLEGMPEVDREFYLVQGELYTQGKLEVLANVGMLAKPTTLAEYNAGRSLPPPGATSMMYCEKVSAKPDSGRASTHSRVPSQCGSALVTMSVIVPRGSTA